MAHACFWESSCWDPQSQVAGHHPALSWRKEGKRLPRALGKTKDELMPWHKPGFPSMGTRSSLFEDWFNNRNMLNPDSHCGCIGCELRVLRQHFTPRYCGFTLQKNTGLIYWVKRLHTHSVCICVYFCLWYNTASFKSKGIFWITSSSCNLLCEILCVCQINQHL